MLQSHVDYLCKRNNLIQDEQCHYFVTSASGWCANKDLFQAITKHKRYVQDCRWDTKANVYFLPIPEDSEYLIEDCRAKEEGAEFIATIHYPKKR